MTTAIDHVSVKRPPASSWKKIIKYWAEIDPDWTYSYFIGWGEPFCFACEWLAPVPDGGIEAWDRASGWFDKAHLQDHCRGGSSEPFNIVPLCHLCHQDMPTFGDRDEALEWVKSHPKRDWKWQLWTQAAPHKNTDRSRTMLRMRTKFLEFDNSLKQASLDGTLEAWLEQTKAATQQHLHSTKGDVAP